MPDLMVKLMVILVWALYWVEYNNFFPYVSDIKKRENEEKSRLFDPRKKAYQQMGFISQFYCFLIKNKLNFTWFIIRAIKMDLFVTRVGFYLELLAPPGPNADYKINLVFGH